MNFSRFLLIFSIFGVVVIQPLRYACAAGTATGGSPQTAQTFFQESGAPPSPTLGGIEGFIVKMDKRPTLKEIQLSPTEMKKLDGKAKKKLSQAGGVFQKFYKWGEKDVENSDNSVDVVNENKTVLDAFGLGLRDSIELSPAYIDGYTLREDGFIPGETLNPLHWFLRNNYPLDITIQSNQEIDFWRLFKTYHDATHTRKIPIVDFVANDLPVNSHILLHDLKPGTTVRFKVPLNLFVGGSYYLPLGTMAFLNSRVGKLYTGEYEVYVFRGSKDMARIRLVADRTNDWQEIYKVGFGDSWVSQYTPFHILENIGFAILKLNDVGGVQIDAKKGRNAFLADYTLNLKYPEVRKAYNKLFGRALIFRNGKLNTLVWKIVDPLSSQKHIRNILVNDLTGIEKIYGEDVSKPFKDRRVDRNFIGSDTSFSPPDLSTPIQWHVGLGAVFKISQQTSCREHWMTTDYDTKSGKLKHKYYIFQQCYSHHSSSAFFNIFHFDLVQDEVMMFKADKHYNPFQFKTLGLYYELQRTHYGNRANRAVITYFHNILVPQIFSDLRAFLADHNLLHLRRTWRTMRVSAQYYLNDHGLEAVEHRYYGYTPRQLHDSIMYHLAMAVRSAKGLKSSPMYLRPRDEHRCIRALRPSGITGPNDPALRYCRDLLFITKYLSEALNLSLPANVRKTAFENLLLDDLFKEMGPAWIASVIPKSDLAKSVAVQLEFYLPKHIKPISYYWPRDVNGNPVINVKQRKFIESIFDAERMYNNQYPDMRLNCTHNSTTCRKTRFEGTIRHGETNNTMQPQT